MLDCTAGEERNRKKSLSKFVAVRPTIVPIHSPLLKRLSKMMREAKKKNRTKQKTPPKNTENAQDTFFKGNASRNLNCLKYCKFDVSY